MKSLHSQTNLMSMKIKHILVVTAALALIADAASAQNLDPTVVVNRAYEGKLVQMHKPSFEMAVPDSVSTFALEFDYLVTEKPYQGADGFNPYVLTMKPASALQMPMKLYLKAGAGYTLHPTLDFVWAPLREGAFRMDVYARHRSYVGDYRSYRPQIPAEGGVLEVDRWRNAGGDQAHWKGYDFMSEAGVDGRYDWTSVYADFDVAYYGLASKDLYKKRMYDALDVKLGVASKPANTSYFMYDVQVGYRFAEDKLSYALDRDYIGEHLFDVDARIGQVLKGHHKILLDADIELAAYSHYTMSSTAAQLTLTPHYVYARDRWGVDAGIRISTMLRSDEPQAVFGTRQQVVYPDVKAYFQVIPDAMRLYADIGGGSRMNTYASLLEGNHHLDPAYVHGNDALMDLTVERVSASIGLEGRAGSVFNYNIRTGYVNYKSALLDAVAIGSAPSLSEPAYLAGVGYAPCQKYYAALDWRLDVAGFTFDGDLVYNHVWGLDASQGLFAPAKFTGDVAFEYNWSRRIYAGIDCSFSTARSGYVRNLNETDAVYEAIMPGYADLGAYFEFAFTRSFSIWARGGNLLNMAIQRNPLYAERGVSCTVGICLNL